MIMRMKPPSSSNKTNPIKPYPERSEFTLSVIEGNGPISNPATAFLLITQDITAVDSEKKIIVACDLTNQSNDKQQFEPMLELQIKRTDSFSSCHPRFSYSTEQSVRVHGLVVDANIINNTDSKG